MRESYGRDLDLNLLRVFLVVAEAGSVTEAAGRLYLTQPAVSAALTRLTRAVGTPLFVRQGRRLVLSSRGSQLRLATQQHLPALVDAALSPAAFDAASSERELRLGLSDAAESWLLPRLLRLMAQRAPRLRLIVLPVQFRSVGDYLASGALHAAATVCDELPASVLRAPLLRGDFVCLLDRQHAGESARLSERVYFERYHVVVSYNADGRGIVEDTLRRSRKVRCSVASFANLAAIVEGSDLIATVPRLLANDAMAKRPRLVIRELPFRLEGATTELLWPRATDDDEACRFLRQCVADAALELAPGAGARAPRVRARSQQAKASSARGSGRGGGPAR